MKKIKVGDIVYVGRESEVPFTVIDTNGYLVQLQEDGYSPSWLDVSLVRTKK